MSTARTETIECPRCEAEMTVTLEWEPEDTIFGRDADGNRGIRLPGYWTADDMPRCPKGCELDEGEQKDVQAAVRDLETNGPDYEAEYTGPDEDDRDDPSC